VRVAVWRIILLVELEKELFITMGFMMGWDWREK